MNHTPGPRLVGGDLLRAVATVAVIAIHASHWPATDPGLARAVWTETDTMSRFAVPAFLMLTGVVLTYGGNRRPGPGWIPRRMSRSLVPWLFWTPVYAVAGLFVTHDIDRRLPALLTWVEEGGGHLYYLLIVPQFYVLWLIWPRARAAVWPVAAVMFAVQLLLGWYRLYEPFPGGVVERFLLWRGYLVFPLWLGYFALGVAFGHLLDAHGEEHPWPALAALVSMPFAGWLLVGVGTRGSPHPDFGGGSGAFLRPTLAPLAVGVVLACMLGGRTLLRGAPWLARAVLVVGKYSLGIYIIHPLVLYLAGRILLRWLWQPLLVSSAAFVLLVVVTLVTTLAAVRLLVASPLAAVLGSAREPLTISGSRPPAG